MAEKETSRKALLLTVIFPLAALISLIIATYAWYRVLKPEKIPQPVIIQSKVTPEAFSAGLEGNLVAVLSAQGIDRKDIKRKDADMAKDGVRAIYTVKVPENISLTLLNLKITMLTRNMGGSVFQGLEGSNGATLTITLGSGKTPTDIVILKKSPGIELRQAKMAIIIDDLGIRNIDSARRFCALQQIVTLSVLPFQPHTSQVVDLARESGNPYILHMPMEPQSSEANPGEGAIRVGDTKQVMVEKLTKAFRSVRGAEGMNNHMGSKATESLRTMEIVMEFLSSNNYFFIDSRTSLNTVGYSLSHKAGVKSAIIDGYLDVADNQAAIEKKLDNLAAHALDTGSSVVIGHDKPNTLAVIERKLPELEKKGITFVKITDLLR
ncbi:divergent polysaccharide deacetylase family protein [bacterium]|nr:divergent polysaccharide deacetylase family protein [bacterium]